MRQQAERDKGCAIPVVLDVVPAEHHLDRNLILILGRDPVAKILRDFSACCVVGEILRRIVRAVVVVQPAVNAHRVCFNAMRPRAINRWPVLSLLVYGGCHRARFARTCASDGCSRYRVGPASDGLKAPRFRLPPHLRGRAETRGYTAVRERNVDRSNPLGYDESGD